MCALPYCARMAAADSLIVNNSLTVWHACYHMGRYLRRIPKFQCFSPAVKNQIDSLIRKSYNLSCCIGSAACH